MMMMIMKKKMMMMKKKEKTIRYFIHAILGTQKFAILAAYYTFADICKV